PSVCTHGRRLVHDDAAAHFSGTAGQQIPLFTPVDHTAFQVFLAANRPAEGKVQPGGVKVDAKPPDACLLEPGFVAIGSQGVVVLTEAVFLAGPGAGRTDGYGPFVGDDGTEAEFFAQRHADHAAHFALPVDLAPGDIGARFASLFDGEFTRHAHGVARGVAC